MPPNPINLLGLGTYEFIGFGAIDGHKPYKFIGFGAIDATKP